MEFKQESKYFFTAGACVFREITTLALRQGRKTQETAVSMATHGVATYIMDGTFWQHHKWENQVSPAPFPGETLAGLNIAFTVLSIHNNYLFLLSKTRHYRKQTNNLSLLFRNSERQEMAMQDAWTQKHLEIPEMHSSVHSLIYPFI